MATLPLSDVAIAQQITRLPTQDWYDFFRGIATTAASSGTTSGIVINVMDHGATGDGVTNDTTSIQAAISAAGQLGLPHPAIPGGIVFFPPGTYIVTATLKNNIENTRVRLVGAGKHYTKIIGSVPGWLIDSDREGDTLGGFQTIEHLTVINDRNNADAGAIRFENVQTGVIAHCMIQGYRGVLANENAYRTVITQCDIHCQFGSGAGRIGAEINELDFVNNSTVGWSHGLWMRGHGCCVVGGRFEVNTAGIRCQSNGFFIGGLSCERNDVAIWLDGCSNGTLTGVITLGADVATGSGSANTALWVTGAFDTVVQGFQANSVVSVAGIDISANIDNRLTFISCHAGVAGGSGVAWLMPTGAGLVKKYYIKFFNCNNPAHLLTFAELPPSPIEGEEWDVSDSNTAVWGATIAGGGANKVKARYNGTNWTVVAK